jgi:hypothetical protein
MIIRLNGNKITTNTHTMKINKKNGENIAFFGNAMDEINLSFFQQMIGQKLINKSIHINTLGDSSYHNKLHCIVPENLSCISFFSRKKFDLFSKINIKKHYKVVLNDHTIFSLPCLEKCPYITTYIIHKKMLEFLSNLPNNKDKKEIPIFINNFSHMNMHQNKQMKILKALMKKLNKKGYFFINIFRELDELSKEEPTKDYFNQLAEHVFISNQPSNQTSYHFNYIENKNSIIKLRIGEYFYYKNMVLKNNKSNIFPYKRLISSNEKLEPINLKEIIIQQKIKDF